VFRRIVSFACCLAVLGATPLVAPPRAEAAYPGVNGKIAFVSERAGNLTLDIHVMDANGANVVKLTSSPYADLDPTWSPGGTMIAFTRYTASFTDGEIWIMQADGSGLTRLTNHPADDYAPSWSPDGSRIAFSSNRDGDYEIYAIPISGGAPTQLTSDTNGFHDVEPAWSPDGTRIAFISNKLGKPELYLMNSDGTDRMRILFAATEYGDRYPNWSPDGLRIVIQHTMPAIDGVTQVIETITAEGSSPDIMYHLDAVWDSLPAYAPDGTQIVYDSDMDDPDPGDAIPEIDVYAVAIDHSGPPTRLTNSPGLDIDPDWQPIPAFPLVDARFSAFNSDIQWVFNEGITTGCSAERYCPDASVTRGQMASFLARALDLPNTATDFFTDDETSIHEVDINRLAAAGITTGCAPGLYCPTGLVTREQMASFLVRALSLPSTGTDYFTDDEASIHEPNINALAAAAITTGCTATTYCPLANVTRGQMAAFLHRALI